MATNLLIIVNDNNVAAALTKLKKLTIMTGLLKEIKRRSFFMKPSAKRRLKSVTARKKLRKVQREFERRDSEAPGTKRAAR